MRRKPSVSVSRKLRLIEGELRNKRIPSARKLRNSESEKGQQQLRIQRKLSKSKQLRKDGWSCRRRISNGTLIIM